MLEKKSDKDEKQPAAAASKADAASSPTASAAASNSSNSASSSSASALSNGDSASAKRRKRLSADGVQATELVRQVLSRPVADEVMGIVMGMSLEELQAQVTEMQLFEAKTKVPDRHSVIVVHVCV